MRRREFDLLTVGLDGSLRVLRKARPPQQMRNVFGRKPVSKKLTILSTAAIAALSIAFTSAPVYAAVTFVPPDYIHLTGADYQQYKRTGRVGPVIVGQQREVAPPYALQNYCAFQVGGSVGPLGLAGSASWSLNGRRPGQSEPKSI